MPGSALQREFWTALATTDLVRIRGLVGSGADVNLPIGNLGAETPLIRAVASGNSELVRLLIELGADVDLPSHGPRIGRLSCTRPGCATHLDTKIPRWRFGERGL